MWGTNYMIYEANPATLIIVMGSVMVTPFYLLLTYAVSGASLQIGSLLAGLVLLWGAVMSWLCLIDIIDILGDLGNLIVPLSWILPNLVVVAFQKFLLAKPLNQKYLVGLQLFRAIGGVFLIEYGNDRNIPGIFAFPAGIGDIVTAVVALVILIVYRKSTVVPGFAVYSLIGVGIGDFLSAFFFGFTSSESPAQLFHPDPPSKLIQFPTGMIPLFLVPYAILFHTLSLLTQLRNTPKTRNDMTTSTNYEPDEEEGAAAWSSFALPASASAASSSSSSSSTSDS